MTRVKLSASAYVTLVVGEWDISLSTAGWRRGRYHEMHPTREVRQWDCGPLLAIRETPAKSRIEESG